MIKTQDTQANRRNNMFKDLFLVFKIDMQPSLNTSLTLIKNWILPDECHPNNVLSWACFCEQFQNLNKIDIRWIVILKVTDHF